MNQLTCYGCDHTKPKSEMRFECMCTERKGVCKSCIDEVKSGNLEITIPEHHNLSKLHDFTPEFQKYMDEVRVACGGQHDGMEGAENGTRFIYYEGPNGEKEDALRKMIDDGTVDLMDCMRSVLFPPMPKMCSCC